VSTPSVPDTEKLSWLVLGRSPEQQGGGDSALLLAAAQTILGGQEGGFLRQIQQGLGIDEFGVKSGQFGANGQQATSRVASTTGFGSSQTVNGQIVSVGKRLSSNALLSYEQSLNTTDTVVKLTLDLSRQFSLVGRAGTESALDVFWHHSFGK
jgi:translocation and assembly module TamB